MVARAAGLRPDRPHVGVDWRLTLHMLSVLDARCMQVSSPPEFKYQEWQPGSILPDSPAAKELIQLAVLTVRVSVSVSCLECRARGRTGQHAYQGDLPR